VQDEADGTGLGMKGEAEPVEERGVCTEHWQESYDEKEQTVKENRSRKNYVDLLNTF
jgi:hypothetical protein